MTASERGDARRRWAMAATASVLLHLSLLWWWKGSDVAPGSGPAGGGGGHRGFAPGSVIDVQIDVESPLVAGTKVPAEEVTTMPPTPADIPLPTPSPVDTSSQPSESTLALDRPGTTTPSDPGAGGGSGSGVGLGIGSGSGDAAGSGSGDGGVPGGVGARTGDAGQPPPGVVPPRPVEITWPDTRKLSHCVGLRIDVRIRVDETGRVERVEPASQGLPPDCVRAALDTAKRIRFMPGTVGGKPAVLWSLVTIDFEKKK